MPGDGESDAPRAQAIAGVHQAVRAGGLFARDRPALVMLSGGRDSTCLLDVAVELLGAGAVAALHVNYGLRAAAGEDELHCRELCRRLGVQLDVVHAPPGAPSPPGRGSDGDGATGMGGGVAGGAGDGDGATGMGGGGAGGAGDGDGVTGMGGDVVRGDRDGAGDGDGATDDRGAVGNLQAWARDVRYAEAERLAQARDALIAAGHTASDQVETVLYRLAASPGRRALLGMAPAEGRLIRPLLSVTREQTAAYCRARGLAWREDESNDDPRFARARVRHGLLPALREVHPAAETNVLRTAALLRGEAELLESLVEAELGEREEIAIARLRELPDALARLVVVRLAEHAAGTYVPQAGGRVEELLALGRRGGRAELHLGGRAGAVIERGTLRIVRLPPRNGPRAAGSEQHGDRPGDL